MSARAVLTRLLCALALNPALAQTPDEQSDLAYTAATTALSQQDWAQAALNFERVLMFNPLHAEARVQLALLFARQGKPAAAAGFLQSLIADPRTPSAHRTRLQTLLAQLNAPQPSAPAPPPPAPRLEATFSAGYTTNPHARADLSTLTLTLPQGRTTFAVDQSPSPAPVVTANLSYLAPNQCGLDASHQSWGGAEPQSASRLLLFCHADVQGQRLQLFASTQQSSDGAERTTLGTTWPTATWRLTAQLFQEPAQDRQGYGLRLDHLYPASATLVFIEAEHTTTGQPGFTKLGLQQAYPLTPALSLSGLLTYQRDASAYSPLLENGAPRQLTLAQANLQHTLGTFGGWKVASLAQLTHRSSNIKLFEFNEFTVNIAFKKLF